MTLGKVVRQIGQGVARLGRGHTHSNCRIQTTRGMAGMVSRLGMAERYKGKEGNVW